MNLATLGIAVGRIALAILVTLPPGTYRGLDGYLRRARLVEPGDPGATQVDRPDTSVGTRLVCRSWDQVTFTSESPVLLPPIELAHEVASNPGEHFWRLAMARDSWRPPMPLGQVAARDALLALHELLN